MTIVEKVAYLRGLSEGLNLNADKAETKMTLAILDVLEELAEDNEDLRAQLDLVSAQVDEIDEDLGNVEELIYGGCDCDDDCDCGCEAEDECDCGCGCDCDHDHEENAEYYEVECPACHEVICVDEGILEEGSVECPNCGEKLEFEIEFDDAK